MRARRDVRLADLTTLRVGGVASQLVEVDDTDELVEAVSDVGHDGCLILGGGSNVVVGDAGVDVPVIRVMTRGVAVEESEAAVDLTVAAGEPWDALVDLSVVEGWSGIEALSGIPGLVGATPIQNVGAYGQELADVVVGVEVLDRSIGRRRAMSRAECEFGYRRSVFKHEPGRFCVLAVRLRLVRSAQSRPVRYAELARSLGLPAEGTAPLASVRESVLALRRGKGMVLDPEDHDTWSVGSFFTNPILADASRLPAGAPRWPLADSTVKTSAAWLIEQAGFGKGFGSDVGRGVATLSGKHPLALTNRGTATTEELLSLARIVQDGVREAFGVELSPEPTLVGCHL